MIELMFNRANEIVLIRITGNKVEFGNTMFGAMMGTIDGLKLEYSGVIKEFPDLRDSLDWRVKAIERFKKHITSLGSEWKIGNYLIDDLKLHGYKIVKIQKNGMRPQNFERNKELRCRG